MTDTTAPARPSRRAITSALWTTPILVACAPAPAFAASGFTCSPSYCKKQNRNDDDRWDFTVYVNGILDGKATNPKTVFINGVAATLRYDQRGRAYYDLRNQRHSYTFLLRIIGPTGAIVFDKVVDTRQSSCPA